MDRPASLWLGRACWPGAPAGPQHQPGPAEQPRHFLSTVSPRQAPAGLRRRHCCSHSAVASCGDPAGNEARADAPTGSESNRNSGPVPGVGWPWGGQYVCPNGILQLPDQPPAPLSPRAACPPNHVPERGWLAGNKRASCAGHIETLGWEPAPGFRNAFVLPRKPLPHPGCADGPAGRLSDAREHDRGGGWEGLQGEVQPPAPRPRGCRLPH